MSAVTTCETCGITRNETVEEHLAELHPDEFFRITVDPATDFTVIGRRIPDVTPGPVAHG